MNVLQAVYEYPPKLSRAERQVKAAHDIEEHRKMQRNMYKNILLGVGAAYFDTWQWFGLSGT